MLILSRKEGEIILIDGKKIVLKVLHINGSYVSLGIEAPKDITILRSEVYEREKNKSITEKLIYGIG